MSFELQQAIDEFCAGISVARSQDEAIRQEVASHLRAKVDYYLEKRQLTEQEAFILASQSMGDPKAFVEELRGVHRVDRVAGQAFGLVSVLGMILFVQISEWMLSVLGDRLVAVSLADNAPLWYLFKIAWFLTSCAVPVGAVMLFGKMFNGYGSGTPAARVRRNVASLVATGALVVAVGAYGYSWYDLVWRGMHGQYPRNPWFEYSLISLNQLFFGVMAYLACWLAYAEDKRTSDNLKAALTPLGAWVLTLGVIFVAGYARGANYSSSFSLASCAPLLLWAFPMALACLGGWLAFTLRARRMRAEA